jgi:hypothetical protein
LNYWHLKTPVNNPEERIQHLENEESLKNKKPLTCICLQPVLFENQVTYDHFIMKGRMHLIGATGDNGQL